MTKKPIYTADQIKSIYGVPSQQQTPQITQPVPQEQGILENIGGKIESAAGGLASGIGGAVLTGIDYLGRKAVDKFGTEQMKQNLESAPSLNEQFKQQFGGTENPNTYGAGQLVGEIGSLAAPVAQVGKVAKIGAETLGAGKLGSKLVQAGTEGAAFTAGQALQEGKNQSLKDYALNAGINMAFPAAGAIGKKIAETAPARIINSLIKPLAKDFAYGKNPGKTISELGIKANDFDSLISQIKDKKQAIGQQLGAVYQKYLPQSTSGDITYITKHLDDAIANAQKTPKTNSALITRLEGVREDLLQNASAGPQELKQLVGDLTKWTGNATDDQAVNKALKQTYGSIRENIDNQIKPLMSPEEFANYKKASEQYGDLISAENAAVYRDKILQRHDLISFGAKNSALLAALGTSLATGGPSLNTLLAGAAGAGIDKALASTAFKTRLASILTKLGPKEVSTFFEKVPTAKTLYNEQQIKSFIDKKTQPGFVSIGGKIKDVSRYVEKGNKYSNIASKLDTEDRSIMQKFIGALENKSKISKEFSDKMYKLVEQMGLNSNATDLTLKKQFEMILNADRDLSKKAMKLNQ